MANVGYATMQIIPSLRGFDKTVRGQLGVLPTIGGQTGQKTGSRIMSSVGGILKKGFRLTGIAAGAAFSFALYKGFQRLSAIENAEASLRGLGHSAKSVSKIMGNALASVLDTRFALDEAATTAASLVASGIKPGKELERTLKLVADAATIGNTSMGDMGQIFAKVAAGGRLMGDDLNQMTARGLPVLQLLADQFGVTTIEMRKMIGEGEVGFDDFAKAIEKGMGGAALEAGDTVSSAFANMQIGAARLVASFLKGIFPDLKGAFKSITERMKELEPAAKRWGKTFAEVAKSIIAFLIPILKTLFNVLGDIINVILDVTKFLVRNWDVIKKIGMFIAAVFIPHWIALGVAAANSAAKQAQAWLLTKARAIEAAAAHSQQVIRMVAKWVTLKAAALLNAAGIQTAWGKAALASTTAAGATVPAARRVGLAATTMGSSLYSAGGKAGGMGGKVAGAAAATGGLARVAGGLGKAIPYVGAALSIFGIVAATSGDNVEEAKVKVQDFTAAITQDNGVLGQNTQALIANALQQEGFVGNLTRIGIGMNEVNTAVQKGGSSLTALKTKIFENARAAGLSNTQSELLASTLGRLSGQYRGGAAAARSMAIFTGVATKATYPLYQALQKAGASAGTTKKVMGAYGNAIKDAGSKTGITTAKKNQYIAAMQRAIQKNPELAGVLRKYINVVKSIPVGRTTKISASTASGLKKLAEFKRKYDGIQSKSIYINAAGTISLKYGNKRWKENIHSGGFILPSGKIQRYHSGGVAGLRPDEITAVLQKGEGILSRRAMSLFGVDNLHALNRGAVVKGGDSKPPVTIVHNYNGVHAMTKDDMRQEQKKHELLYG